MGLLLACSYRVCCEAFGTSAHGCSRGNSFSQELFYALPMMEPGFRICAHVGTWFAPPAFSGPADIFHAFAVDVSHWLTIAGDLCRAISMCTRFTDTHVYAPNMLSFAVLPLLQSKSPQFGL